MTRLIAFSLTLPMVALVGCGRTHEIPTAEVRGTVTVKGKPVEGVQVTFVPKAKIRPAIGLTDAHGRYRAEFTSTQSGVPLGPCVVQLSVYRGEAAHNYLPKEFNENASEKPELHLDIPNQGLEFNYDIKYDGEIPPFKP